MSVLLTKSCQYAIQAVLFLATKQKNKPVLQRDIAESLDIPVHFLGKILQQLVKQNIVSSQKGKLGGFFLSYPFAKVTLYKIAQIIDGENFLDGCMVGFPFCSDKSPCPLHEDRSPRCPLATAVAVHRRSPSGRGPPGRPGP